MLKEEEENSRGMIQQDRLRDGGPGGFYRVRKNRGGGVGQRRMMWTRHDPIRRKGGESKRA